MKIAALVLLPLIDANGKTGQVIGSKTRPFKTRPLRSKQKRARQDSNLRPPA
jgi:hypothetical protein